MPKFTDIFASRSQEWMWGTDAAAKLPIGRRWSVTLLRYVYVTLRDLMQGELVTSASSLAYTTLLSLVPLLAVSFSLFKAFGIHNQLEPTLWQLLAPLGDRTGEITSTVIGFVDNMNVGALGTIGVALLFYTTVSLMQKIERAFNNSWNVPEHRRFRKRFSDYLSVLIVGPIFVFAALGITGAAANNAVVRYLVQFQPFGTAIHWLSGLVPYLMIIGAFTVIYVYMPNTRVHVRSALVGAVVAGILWQTVGWGFARFVATSTQYTAVYSAFASLILFIIWIYVAWLVLLIGANIAFYHQHPEQLRFRSRTPRFSLREQELLALVLMKLIAEQQYEGQPLWTLRKFAGRLQLAEDALHTALAALERAGLLAKDSGNDPQYLPARPLEMITLDEVVAAVRGAHGERMVARLLTDNDSLQAPFADYERAGLDALRGQTIKQLALNEVERGDNAQTDAAKPL